MSELPRYQCPRCKCVVEALTESPPICSGPAQYDPNVGGPIYHVHTQMVRVDLERKVDSKAAAHQASRSDAPPVPEPDATYVYEDPHDSEHAHIKRRLSQLEFYPSRLEKLERAVDRLNDDRCINGLQQQIDQLSQRISDQPGAGTWEGFTGILRRQLDQLVRQVDHLEKSTNYNFETSEELGGRLQKLEESILGAHADRIDALESRANGHTKRIGELELAKSGPGGTDLWERLSRIERDFGGLQDRMETALDHHHNRLRKLERKGSE